MSTNIYQPYTYLIGWSNLNTYYYGVRYAKNCCPSELWVTYFTSSKHVKNFVLEHGDPDVIHIRKVFDCREDAIGWENKVLKRIKVVNDDRFLNKTDNKAISYESVLKGCRKKKSDITRQRMSEYQKGRTKSEEHCRRISESKKGTTYAPEILEKKKDAMNRPEVKEKLSKVGKTLKGDKNPFYGKTHNEETRKRISQNRKGKSRGNEVPVTIDGTTYKSIKDAAEQLSINEYFIRKYLKTGNL